MVAKITGTVIGNYASYIPPNFQSDFLIGREEYFWKGYHWAFYAHIVAGPISLVLGTILLSQWLRAKHPLWHRRLGRVQTVGILLLVAPSGLWMARYSASGPIAGAAFATLAVLTAITAALGWRAAVHRRFGIHRIWMERCYALLWSAVVIRLFGGIAILTAWESDWYYPTVAWLSWILPLAGLEAYRRVTSKHSAG